MSHGDYQFHEPRGLQVAGRVPTPCKPRTMTTPLGLLFPGPTRAKAIDSVAHLLLHVQGSPPSTLHMGKLRPTSGSGCLGKMRTQICEKASSAAPDPRVPPATLFENLLPGLLVSYQGRWGPFDIFGERIRGGARE